MVTYRMLTLAGLLAATCCFADGWEVRYAQVADQTDEWTRMGRVPGWQVRVGEPPDEQIDVTGDEADGRFRGTLLIGKRITVPEPLPAGMKVSLEYQTYCAMNEPAAPRSGIASVAAFTPERWEQFAKTPQDAQKWTVRPDLEGVLGVWSVHANNQDVTDWQAWEAPDVLPRLRDHAGRDVILAIVWSAMHFCEEWSKFRRLTVKEVTREELDRGFMQDINWEYPGLEPGRAAWERGDVPAAKQAFIDYMRARQTPPGPTLAPDGSAAGLQAAQNIIGHVFSFVGCPPTKLGERILWNEDPHDYEQWAIALNRHTHWISLARAYLATRDSKYATEFVAQLNNWVDSMPVALGQNWVQGPFDMQGKSPLTLDAGIRMAQSWWQAYYAFRDAPEFDTDSQLAMMRSFRDHAAYLMQPHHFHAASNWGAMEANGLFHVAVMLPEMRDAPVWLETARNRLVECMQAQVYPDGAQIELTPGYHSVTTSNLVMALELSRRTGAELPEELLAGLERMYAYYAAIMMPDGLAPALNDSGWQGLRGLLKQGADLFPHRKDLAYLATGGKEGTPPDWTSIRLPYAGFNVMRSGWGPTDRYLMFENGPYGSGHQHEDKLGIILHACGRRLLTEGGTYSYDRSDWRRFILSTWAHNTVLVDGQGQRRATLKDTFTVWEPENVRWLTSAGADYAEGEYASGYGLSNETRVRHRRQVFFAKPAYWVVVDTMIPEDDKPHTYEALFNLDVDEAVVEPGSGAVTATFGGGAMRIVPLGTAPADVRIVTGQREPAILGWVPTGKHNQLRPIPAAVVRWQGSGAMTQAYVLYLREGDASWEVEEVKNAGAGMGGPLALEVRLPGGVTDLYARQEADDRPTKLGSVVTDADFARVRLDAGGRVVSLDQIGGSQLTVDTTEGTD